MMYPAVLDPLPLRGRRWAGVRRRLLFLVVAVAIAILYSWRLGARSFWEPDEPRYSEIGREMLTSGDWVIPRLNFANFTPIGEFLKEKDR